MSLPFNFSSQKHPAVTDPGVEAGGMATFERERDDFGGGKTAGAADQPRSPYLAGPASPQAPIEVLREPPSFHSGVSVTPIPSRPRQEALRRATSTPTPVVATTEPYQEELISAAVRAIQAQIEEMKMALGDDLGRSEHATELRLDDLSATLQRDIRDLNARTEAETQQIKDDLFSAAMGMSALRDQQQVLVAEINVVRAAVAQQAETLGTEDRLAVAGQISAVQETMAALEQQTSASIAAAEEAVRVLNARFDSLAVTSSALRALGERVDSLDSLGVAIKSLESRLDSVALSAASIKAVQSRLDALAKVGDGMVALEARVESIITRDLGVLKHRTERAEERAARAIAALESISDEHRLASLWNVPEEPPEAQKFASCDTVGRLSERIDELAAKQRFSDTLLKSVELSVMERCERMVAAKLAVMADDTTAEMVEMESRLHRQMPIEAPSVEEPEGYGLLAMDAQTEQRVADLVEELVSGKLKSLVAPLVRADLSRMLGAILPTPMSVAAKESPTPVELEAQKEVEQ